MSGINIYLHFSQYQAAIAQVFFLLPTDRPNPNHRVIFLSESVFQLTPAEANVPPFISWLQAGHFIGDDVFFSRLDLIM
jgi:hypothetical protein